MDKKIRVLVVDDSALARRMLTDFLNKQSQIEVVGTAQDGSFVLQKIRQLQPDVVTLDVEMRKVGGLEILPEIVNKFNLPVIMVSSLTERGAHATLKALELGAADFVTKPQAAGIGSIQEIVDILTKKIVAVARSRRFKPAQEKKVTPASAVPVSAPKISPSSISLTKPLHLDVIAIGASTGGTEAIKDVLTGLPNTLPGIVIVQHMPAGFTLAFANRLNSICNVFVKEAADGDELLPGTALLAPGDYHMIVRRGSGRIRVQLMNSEPVNRHRPSVDVLFRSVAEQFRDRSLGVILTGMGSDGAQGLKFMRDYGAVTLAQDEASCVVFGMPKEAIKIGGAAYTSSLSQIPSFLVKNILHSTTGFKTAGLKNAR